MADATQSLLEAVSSNAVDRAKKALADGGDINVRAPGGKTLLHLAVSRHPDMLPLLLGKGKHLVNVKDDAGNTPLHTAVDSPDAVRALLQGGADATIPDNNGKTAFDLVRERLDGLQARLKKPLNDPEDRKKLAREIKDTESSFFMLAAASGNKDAITRYKAAQQASAQDPAVVEARRAEAATDQAAATARETRDAFRSAFWGGNSQEIAQFMAAHPDEFNKGKNDALQLAVRAGNANVVRFLLKNGADATTPHAEVSYGEFGTTRNEGTLLHWVAEAPRDKAVEVATALVASGADPAARGAEGTTTLQWAAMKNNVPLMKFLLGKKVDINATDEHGQTALHHAVASGNAEAAQFLIENGASLNMPVGPDMRPAAELRGMATEWPIYKKGQEGQTALHIAAGMKPDLLKVLVQKKADLNVVDGKGNTALHVAANAGQFDNVLLLIESGARLDIRNKDGKTALELVTERFKTPAQKAKIVEAMQKNIQMSALGTPNNSVMLAQHGLPNEVRTAIESLNGSLSV